MSQPSTLATGIPPLRPYVSILRFFFFFKILWSWLVASPVSSRTTNDYFYLLRSCVIWMAKLCELLVKIAKERIFGIVINKKYCRTEFLFSLYLSKFLRCSLIILYHLEHSNCCLYFYCYTHNISVDAFFAFLQVFHVRLGSPHFFCSGI